MKKTYFIDFLIGLFFGSTIALGLGLLLSFLFWTWYPDLIFFLSRAGLAVGFGIGISLIYERRKREAA